MGNYFMDIQYLLPSQRILLHEPAQGFLRFGHVAPLLLQPDPWYAHCKSRLPENRYLIRKHHIHVNPLKHGL